MHGLGIKLSQGGFIVNILFKGGGGGDKCQNSYRLLVHMG